MIHVIAPTRLQLLDLTPDEEAQVERFLTFRDRQVTFLLDRHKKNFRWRNSDFDGWASEKADLEARRVRCLLERDEDGRLFTYSGLASDIQALLRNQHEIVNDLVRPEAIGIAWNKAPKHALRPYQAEAVDLMLETPHSGISLPTGSGKSLIITELNKRLGLPSLIMAPTKSIAGQLYREMTAAFGKRNVGLYGDGKKELKLFTVGIAASLTRIEPETPAWEHFSDAQVFIADESHMCPAATLERVCMGLVAKAPYRYFVSATQTRNDGSEMVLKGITGPLVMERTLKELVDAGYLARPEFKMLVIESTDHYQDADVQKMIRHHLYKNAIVYQKVGALINGLVKMGQRVLVLVDEITQYPMLLPYLRVESKFAHGGVTKEDRAKLPEQYWDSDPTALVEAFDNGEFPVLVGTGVISMGTDVKSPETVVYLKGGNSVIDFPQSVGRGTRLFTYPDGRQKTAFNFVDVDVRLPSDTGEDRMSALHRHALSRAAMAQELYPGTLRWIT